MQKTSEKQLTGYPSIDKPWLKYYSEDAINEIIPQLTMYGYLANRSQCRLEEVALEYFGRKISYGCLLENIQRLARSFEKNGIEKGDTVTIMSLVTPETIYCIYALNFLGAVANMIYLSLSDDEVREAVKKTKSKMFIVLDVVEQRLHKFEELLPVNKIIILHIDDSMPLITQKIYRIKNKFRTNIATNYKDFVSEDGTKEVVNEVVYEKDMPAIIVYTSGTTGEPKGVVLSNDNFNSIAFQYLYSGIEVDKGDTMMSFMPPFFAIGFSCNIHMPLCLGLKLIICVNPEPSNVSKMFLRSKPNHFLAAPSNVLMIADKISGNAGFCKTIGGGGEAMTVEQIERVNRTFEELGSKARYLTGYGMSELAATVVLSIERAYNAEGLGIPLCKTNVKVVNPDTMEELAYDEVGELCFNTPSQMLYYHDNEEATKKVAREHKDGKIWIHTGDLGSIDKNGFVYFKGRMKRIYMTKGIDGTLYKIFPTRVEELITSYLGVEKCAVVVLDDEKSLNKMIAYISVSEGMLKNESFIKEIEEYCKENLPSHSVPVNFVVLDRMPLTQSGKIDYRALE